VLSYRIDLYLPKVKLAIEFDEFNHRKYDLEAERKREQEIQQHLGCTFFRYNPDDKNFNIFRMICVLRKKIASIERKQKFQVKEKKSIINGMRTSSTENFYYRRHKR